MIGGSGMVALKSKAASRLFRLSDAFHHPHIILYTDNDVTTCVASNRPEQIYSGIFCTMGPG